MGMIAIGGCASASSRLGEQGGIRRRRIGWRGSGERLDESRRLQADALAAEWLRVNGAS
jgi:hypothetical protein